MPFRLLHGSRENGSEAQRNPAPSSPMPEELKRAPLARIRNLLRSGELGIREFLHWTMEELEAVQRRTNAITHRFFEEAEEEAKHWETLRNNAADELPPLAGIPFSVKGVFAIEGAPWVVGSAYRRGVVASFTDPGVARLRRAGAIPLCQTNVPEAAFWIETYNKVYGRTCNPHHPGRTAGGSSGGEAALVGAGAIPFGLGSDTGGSIRIPAAFCGACGLKPSPFAIPNDGHFPLPPRPLRYLMVSGPLTRYAQDLPLLIRHLYEPQHLESFEYGLHAPLKGMKLYLYTRFPGSTPEEEIVACVEEAGEMAASLGMTLRPFSPPPLFAAFLYLLCALAEGSELEMPKILKGKERVALPLEFARYLLGRSPHTLPLLTLTALEPLFKQRFSRWVKEQNEARLRLRELLIRELGKEGILLGPVFPTPAPRHQESLRKPWNLGYTGIYNALGFPALSLPWGKNKEGLPLAVQLAGPPGSDGLLVNLAIALERARGVPSS